MICDSSRSERVVASEHFISSIQFPVCCSLRTHHGSKARVTGKKTQRVILETDSSKTRIYSGKPRTSNINQLVELGQMQSVLE